MLGLLGLLPPSASVSGRVLLSGVDILAGGEDTMRPHRWVDLAIVFQGAMNALNPVYTVGDQVIEAIRAHEDIGPEAAKTRVEKLYRLVGIPTDRIDNYPHEYSGGMKQRAMIAMALALDPKLVIMDEPTTALDVITAAKIMDEVLRIQKAMQMTIIIISHDVSVVAKIANRIAVMYAGQIVEESSGQNIFNRTLHPYTEGLLGAFPSIIGPRTSRRISAATSRGERSSAMSNCPVARTAGPAAAHSLAPSSTIRPRWV